jgi:hypothetical protein
MRRSSSDRVVLRVKVVLSLRVRRSVNEGEVRLQLALAHASGSDEFARRDENALPTACTRSVMLNGY